MSRYGRGSDDGTYSMGATSVLITVAMTIIGFCAGYTIRDSGYKFNATKTPTPQELQK